LSKKDVVVTFFLFGIICFGFLGCSQDKKEGQILNADEKLAQLGKEIFYGQGRCGICHTIGVERGGKCPNLDGAGSRLTREFIYESMIKPAAYVKLDFDADEPKFYPAKMPVVNRSPINLSEDQMQSVIMFIGSHRR